MVKTVNYLNNKWNQYIFWFHDAATKTGIRPLVSLSIWIYDKLWWRLPENWQLVCGVPFKEYLLKHELELAKHQARYFADYSYQLQCYILCSDKQEDKEDKEDKEDIHAESMLITNN